MDTPNEKPLEQKIVNRKDFLLAAAGTTAFLGMTGQAKATGTQAYLDSVETLALPRPSPGPVYFKNGDPWIDVMAYGAMGNGSNNDGPAINAAIAAAIASTAGTNATGNATVYFPPGNYLTQPEAFFLLIQRAIIRCGGQDLSRRGLAGEAPRMFRCSG